MSGNLQTSFAAMAVRNLLRNGWRSGLTAGGIAVSVALMVWTLALTDGFMGTMVRGATAVELGQVQVHRADYADRARPERSFPADEQLVQAVEAVPDVAAASPRIRLWGLLGNEQRSQVARLVGVDAARERRVAPVLDAMQAGHWLSDKPDLKGAREVVLGSALARQMNVKPGDEVVAFLQATDGSLGNDVFKVRGVLETGSQLVDRTTAFVHLDDARDLGALDGQLHELAVKTNDLGAAPRVAEQIHAALARSGRQMALKPHKIKPDDQDPDAVEPLLVRPWSKLVPDLYQMVEMASKSTGSMYFVVYLIAILSIVNTQRMSAWERRREFGVMVAIGMTPGRLFRLVLLETVVLATAGAVLGAALGGVVAWWQSVYGFDMSLFSENGSFSYMGVAFKERVYLSMDANTVVQPAVAMVVIGSLAGLVPAWRAMRLDPATTIAGRS